PDNLTLRNSLSWAHHVSSHVVIFGGQQVSVDSTVVNDHTATGGGNGPVSVNDRAGACSLDWNTAAPTVVNTCVNVSAIAAVIICARWGRTPAKSGWDISVDRHDQPPSTAGICLLSDLFLSCFIRIVCCGGIVPSFVGGLLLLLRGILLGSFLLGLASLSLCFFSSFPLCFRFCNCVVVFFLKLRDLRRLRVNLFLLCKNLIIHTASCRTIFLKSCFNFRALFFKLSGETLIGLDHAI